MGQTIEQKLHHIIHHAYRHAPAFRKMMADASLSPDDIRAVDDLNRIPVLSKDRLIALQQEDPPFGGFLAVPRDSLRRIVLSPGPLYEPTGTENVAIDMILRALSIAGFQPGDVVLNTFNYHIGPFALWMDEALRQVGATVISAGVGAAELQVKMLRELRATAYVGLPSWLMALIQKAEETGLEFRRDFALRKALVSAEPLPPPLRQTLVETYGLTVANVYGTADVGLLAYNTEGGFALRLLDEPVVQVVNPESGQPVGAGEAGEVVVTTFNPTYPLIRLGLGDMALNVDPAPGTSRQQDRSLILVGRVGEALKVRGLFVHPNQLRFALSRVPGVARAQGAITRLENRDQLTLRVVLAGGQPGGDVLLDAIREAVRAICRVNVDHFEVVGPGELAEGAKLLVDEREPAPSFD